MYLCMGFFSYFLLSFIYLFIFFSCSKSTTPFFCPTNNNFSHEKSELFLYVELLFSVPQNVTSLFFSYNTNASEVANWKCFIKRYSENLTLFLEKPCEGPPPFSNFFVFWLLLLLIFVRILLESQITSCELSMT